MTGLSMDQLVSLLANAPATSILALIAYFFIKHIPKWVDRHFGYLERLAESHKEEVKELSATFKSELREEREVCKEYNEKLVAGLEQSNRATLQAFRDVSTQFSTHDAHVREQLQRMQATIDRH